MRPAIRASLFGGALAVSLAVAFLVFHGRTSHWLTAVWFLSLCPFALATREPRREAGSGLRPSGIALLLIVAALPVLVRVASLDATRMHGDEFLTGYFSATHDFAHTSFFGYMPEKWEWQGQFPKPYFFLQRVFLTLFGRNTVALRLSVQVYVAVISVMLFLTVREMLNRASALIAVALYSFLAMSVYLETLALFFIGATAAFTVFFYFAVRAYRRMDTFSAAMSGIACGLCYLMYYSSYLAFPLLVAFAAVSWIRTRRILVLQNFVISLGGMLLVLAPFAAFDLRVGDYALRRANDLSLLSGSMSPHREAIAKGANPIPIVWDNLVLSLKAFFRNGVAGAGGFEFGHFALFDPFSFALLAAGLLAGLMLVSRKTELLFVFLVIGACVGMVAITAPPPTCHRFSIAFPFLVILMTLPFELLLRPTKLRAGLRYAIAGGLLLTFACVNERRLIEAVCRDQPPDEPRVSEFVNQRYPARSLYVAAFNAFAFEKIFYFFDRSKNRHVQTGSHDNLLRAFNRNEKYVYVMIFGDAFRKSFEKADPRGRYFRLCVGYSVFAN